MRFSSGCLFCLSGFLYQVLTTSLMIKDRLESEDADILSNKFWFSFSCAKAWHYCYGIIVPLWLYPSLYFRVWVLAGKLAQTAMTEYTSKMEVDWRKRNMLLLSIWTVIIIMGLFKSCKYFNIYYYILITIII